MEKCKSIAERKGGKLMKWHLIKGVFLLALLLSLTISPGMAKIHRDAIVAIWLFEGFGGVAKDSSGNGHDGVVKGNVKREKDGKFGKALFFPGDFGSYVEVPDHQDLRLIKSITLVGWIKSDFPGWQGDIVGKDEGVPLPNRHYNIHATIPTTGRIYLSGTRCDGKTLVNDGKWHHIAGTWDGKVAKLYTDGILEGEEPFSGSLTSSSVPVRIGIRGNQRTIHGVLDEVGIFNRALSGEEIRELVENGFGPLFSVSTAEKLTATWGMIKRR